MGETTMDFHSYVSLQGDQRFFFAAQNLDGPRDGPLNLVIQ